MNIRCGVLTNLAHIADKFPLKRAACPRFMKTIALSHKFEKVSQDYITEQVMVVN